jgi:hypothetical protein
MEKCVLYDHAVTKKGRHKAALFENKNKPVAYLNFKFADVTPTVLT